MYCPKCGKEAREGMKFCTACGAALVQAGYQQEESMATSAHSESFVHRSGMIITESKEQNERKRYIVLICILITIIIVAGSASFWLLQKQKNYSTRNDVKEDDTEFEWDKDEDFESPKEDEDTDDEEMNADVESESSIEDDNFAFDGLDVEQEVLRIREIYNTVQSDYSDYDENQMDWGRKYSNGIYTKCIVNAGYDNVEQERWYFYENDELIFSFYYAGTDENRFYFYNGRMFRWIDSGKNIHDLETDSSEFQSWENMVLRESDNIIQ